jgi:hypothetical protein
MATLGLIGSENIGGTLARLAVDAGLDVVLSNSRAPQTLSDLVDELGPQARAATPAQAAAAGDWVVVTIPVGAIGTVPREPLVGKTVIDTGNYYPPRDGAIPELEAQQLTDTETLATGHPGLLRALRSDQGRPVQDPAGRSRFCRRGPRGPGVDTALNHERPPTPIAAIIRSVIGAAGIRSLATSRVRHHPYHAIPAALNQPSLEGSRADPGSRHGSVHNGRNPR